MKMLECPNCGNKVESNWQVCPFCSTKLGQEENEIEQRNLNNEDESVESEDIFEFISEDQSKDFFDNLNLPIGYSVGAFNFVKKLGSGENGMVWLVNDKDLSLEKAIKLLPCYIENQKIITYDYKLRSSIDDQSHVVKAEQPEKIIICEQKFYMFPMEFMREGNALKRVKEIEGAEKGRVLEDKLFEVYLNILEAVEHLHGLEIYHNNIKLENMFFKGNLIKLSDFRDCTSSDMLRSQSAYSAEDLNGLGEILTVLFPDKDCEKNSTIGSDKNYEEPRSVNKIAEIILKCNNAGHKDGYISVSELKRALDLLIKQNQETRKKVDHLKIASMEYVGKKDFNNAIFHLEKALELESSNGELSKLLIKAKKERENALRHQVNSAQIMAEQDFVLVSSGVCLIGNIRGQEGEYPEHSVQLNNFFINKYPVSLKEWIEFVENSGYVFDWEQNSWGSNPIKNYCLGDNYPIVNVNWYEALEYCNWRSIQDGYITSYQFQAGKYRLNTKANGYRLPTEAEWEYAARGGNGAVKKNYSGSNKYQEVAWTKENCNELKTRGLLKGNDLDLYDMSGNIFEWCNDWYDEQYYSESDFEEPLGPLTGSKRVLRGGSWNFPANSARVYSRFKAIPDIRREYIGFRLCRSAL